MTMRERVHDVWGRASALLSPTHRWRRAPALLLTCAAALALASWARFGPLPPGLLAEADSVRSTTVFDRHGQVLHEARSGLGTREERLRPDELPQALVAATVAAEDHRFWRHPGLDPIAIARATWRNARSRGRVEGGSTLTQQVAKLLLDRRALLATGRLRSRGWRDKIHEALVAVRLEHHLSKRAILALYLNLAPYGNQVVGAGRASRAYFGAPASMLTPAQAAFLAALPQRPTRFNPWRSVAQATARQQRVIARMERHGLLSPAAASDARAERVRLVDERPPFLAPHFVEMVLAGLPEPRPARVVTTLDAELQRTIEGIVLSQRPLLERHGATNVAIVVLDNATSEWLAWEGSGDFSGARGGAINGAIAPRQPGSALKTFTYALAFESGRTPATVLPDVPATFPTAEEGVVYTPRNYDGRFRGPLLARPALAGSVNVPAVWLASEIGVPDLLRFLRRAGFSTFDRTGAHYGLGVTLGNAEVRLDELTAAYAAFARAGEWRAPRARLEPPLAVSDPVSLVSGRTAFWIADILSDDDARAFVFGRGGHLEFPFPVAVKTGTSQAYHDNWAVGFSRHVTVGVWVGNFDRAPLVGSSGVTGAGPIFHAVMLAAEARAAGGLSGDGQRLADPPRDLVDTPLCALSGMRAAAVCPIRRHERLPADAPQARADAPPCSWHHASDDGVLTIWPEQYRAWADGAGYRSTLDRRASTPAHASGAAGPLRVAVRHDEGLRITSPAEGTVFLLDPTLRAEFQALPLRASAAGASRLRWSVDGRDVGTPSSGGAVYWPLARGRHRAAVRDARGRTAEVTFVVK
jgi:penicillin-binding protein 1C